MTKFEDRLFGDLMASHGHHLLIVERPAPAPQPVRRPAPGPVRVPARRPLWLVAGAVGAAAAAGIATVTLDSASASAAYSVTRHADGSVAVSVFRSSGVAGANGALYKMHARVRVVKVRPGCTPIGSLPRPNPAPHPSVRVRTGVGKNGHRSVTVTLGKGGIPKGDTLILAFTGSPHSGTELGVGGIITGHVPHCVSLPSAP